MFEFNWKFKDYEIRTTHSYGEKPVPYLELVKWYWHNNRQYCYTLAYWYKNQDDGYELHFVGDRPLSDIGELDIGTIWRQLYLAQQMFEDAEMKSREEEWS